MSARRAMVTLGLLAAVGVAVLVRGDSHPVRLGADAGFTYGYLPSVVTNGDLDFSDDAFPFDSSMPHTVTGHAHNAFPVGPAVWWSPGFVAAHGVGALVRAATQSHAPAPDGRSWPYDGLVGLTALAAGVAAVWATYALARRVASPAAALAATLAVWLAGPLVYYTHVATMVSHAPGVAATALLLLAWLGLRDRPRPSLWRIAGLGALAGFVVLTRWQNAVLLIGPVVDVVRGRLRGRGLDLRGSAVFGFAATAAFLPQLVVWSALYGSPFRPPRGEASGAFLDPGRLHVVDVLFSWRHGIFSWHPVLLLGLLGLVVAARRRPLVAGSLLLAFALAVVVNAGVLDWWAGVSFGARRFDGLWPALALGLAVLVDRAPRAVTAAALAACVAVNWLLLNAFTAGLVSGDGPVRPTALWRVIHRTPLLPAIGSWSPRKAVWCAGLVVLALAPLVRWRPMTLPAAHVVPALAGLVAALLATSAVAAAAHTEGRYDAHVFEAGYFVPQADRPVNTDRIVAEGEDVWTLDWAFPGFLPAGRYVATVAGAYSTTGQPSVLAVRADGAVVARATVGARQTAFRGPAFVTRTGFVRLDLRVTGPPIHVIAIRLDPAR